jgi:hypothetical protein
MKDVQPLGEFDQVLISVMSCKRPAIRVLAAHARRERDRGRCESAHVPAGASRTGREGPP